MCGICGILHLDNGRGVSQETLEGMCSRIRHRGPDDAGYHRTDTVGLGMRRLSIIDLGTGHQPIQNEDGSVWIVYNGEVYNFRELRGELLARGHRFSTQTDTEVIVHLYEEYGTACLDRLRGMFALAIWDDRRRNLLLARDRLGIKPLYYFEHDNTLLFASEIKSILAYPSFLREIDTDGLLHYLQFGYVPDPYSIFRFIRKLPPGFVLKANTGGVRAEPFWSLRFDPCPVEDETQLLEQYRDLLRESVRMRLVSDVPLGAFLSGGIDSSTVVAMMAREMGEPVKTFSIGFEEPRFNELPFARMIAEKYHTDHHELIVRPGSIDLIEKIVRSFDEPFGDASAVPTYVLSEMASAHVKVVLSGDGADETLAGYDSYARILEQARYERLPYLIRALFRKISDALPEGFYGKRYMRHILLPGDERFLNSISDISADKQASLLSADLLEMMKSYRTVFRGYLEEAAQFDILSRMQYLDLKASLPSDILVKVDRMSMANSLEVRVPFLDHMLVEFLGTIPPQYKLKGKERKLLLKRAVSDLLPPETLNRKKKGFGMPLKYWFKKDLKQYLKEVLLDRKTSQRGYLDQKRLKEVMREHENGRRDHSPTLWHLLILELWHRIYLDGEA